MRISRFVTMCLFAIVTCAALTSCGDEENGPVQGPSNEDYGSTQGSSNGGIAPRSLDGTKLVLYNSSGKQFMGISHQGSLIYLDTDVMVDYSDRYAPTYQYSAHGNTGNYVLTATKMTYIPYYGTYSYGQFTFDLVLSFSDTRSGKYSGTQFNADGSSKSISGTFSLQYL